MLHHLWHMGISPWEKGVRTAAVYLGILLILRFGGKRSLASLNSLDLVVLLLLSNVVQNAIIGDDVSLVGGLLGAAILIALNWALVRLAYMHPLTMRILQGSGTLLYADGRLDRRNLRRELITREELVAALRRQGMKLDDVDKITLEPEGALNASPKQPEKIDRVLAALERIEGRLR